tara:strand:- start:5827 stop:6594 length:768 start_codon:yes stop_codon:yes gene_type:complete
MAIILTYNINGIRAAIKKDLPNWIATTGADIVCLQEIKAKEHQFDSEIFKELGYYSYINPAEKPGYSGVAVLAKKQPNHVEYGCGISKIDFEGRVIRLDYDNFSVLSVYFPSGSSGELRQSFKIEFLGLFYDYINNLKSIFPNLIIAGDYNICHKAIDIHNPKRNNNTSGFLIEEREWLTTFIEAGFTDSFRVFNKEPHNYSWWSYRANARVKNLGWRIDYIMISNSLLDSLKRSLILSKAIHSDHCPVLIEIED